MFLVSGLVFSGNPDGPFSLDRAFVLANSASYTFLRVYIRLLKQDQNIRVVVKS
jgi:hypothetical protein